MELLELVYFYNMDNHNYKVYIASYNIYRVYRHIINYRVTASTKKPSSYVAEYFWVTKYCRKRGAPAPAAAVHQRVAKGTATKGAAHNSHCRGQWRLPDRERLVSGADFE